MKRARSSRPGLAARLICDMDYLRIRSMRDGTRLVGFWVGQRGAKALARYFAHHSGVTWKWTARDALAAIREGSFQIFGLPLSLGPGDDLKARALIEVER